MFVKDSEPVRAGPNGLFYDNGCVRRVFREKKAGCGLRRIQPAAAENVLKWLGNLEHEILWARVLKSLPEHGANCQSLE